MLLLKVLSSSFILFYADKFTGFKSVSSCVFKNVHAWLEFFNVCQLFTLTETHKCVVTPVIAGVGRVARLSFKALAWGCYRYFFGFVFAVLFVIYAGYRGIPKMAQTVQPPRPVPRPRWPCCAAAGGDLQVRARGASGQVWRRRGSREASTIVNH